MNHVHIALGSQAELDTLIELAQRLKYLSEDQLHRARPELDRTGQLLHGLSRSLEKNLLAAAEARMTSAEYRTPEVLKASKPPTTRYTEALA